MKTTFEIHDSLSRHSRSAAVESGRDQAAKEEPVGNTRATERPWLKHSGKLNHLHRETKRVNRLIEAETEKIDTEMWR